MNLRGGESGAVDVAQRLDHVRNKHANFRRGRIGDLVGAAAKDGMAHAGDLQDGHGGTMAIPKIFVKP
jgi:hypothetical protein